MDNLSFDKIEIQPYLNNSTIYPHLAQTVFKWRTKMFNFECNFEVDVERKFEGNFGGQHQEILPKPPAPGAMGVRRRSVAIPRSYFSVRKPPSSALIPANECMLPSLFLWNSGLLPPPPPK